MITKDKVSDLRSRIRSRVMGSAYVNMPYPMQDGSLARELKMNIEMAIQNAVNAGFDELLTSLYTQENLEDDLGLK